MKILYVSINNYLSAIYKTWFVLFITYDRNIPHNCLPVQLPVTRDSFTYT